MIKIRQSGGQRHRRERETVFQNGPAGIKRMSRKRYIDLGNNITDIQTRIHKLNNLKHEN